MVRDRARRYGERPFMHFHDQQFSYVDIDRLSDRCANGFLHLGVTKDDKISIMLPNRPEFLHVWFGAAKVGAVEVPINTSYKGEFLRHIVDQSDSKLLVVDGSLLERLLPLQDHLPKLQSIVVVGPAPAQDLAALEIPALSFDEFLDAPPAALDIQVRPSDAQSIIYTSGTTGVSKGALGCHAFWIVVAERLLEIRDGGPDDVFYTFLPLYHFNAQVLTVLTTMIAGARMVLADRFSASGFWDDIRRAGATQFNYLGAVMPILAKQPERPDDLDNPARIALGAGCPPAVMEEVERRFGLTCMEGFGMTEIGIPIHVRLDDRRPGSCGRPLDIYDIRLVDDDDREVPVGEPGEIVFRPREPHTMMQGYYNMPEKTLEAYRNLWFHSGDLARRDADGYYYFIDRKKDSLRRRGENISSFEVERAINQHPAVLESAAVAVRSELAEDEVKIYVVLRPGAALSPEELVRWADERMPFFAVPRYVEFLDSLPKTPTERTQKYLLKEAGVTAATWDREKAGVEVRR
ncbi:MAG: AMP-binding protein [Thermoleophilia bacterium]